jgi:hypothetical protein
LVLVYVGIASIESDQPEFDTTLMHIDADKPANEVLPGSLRREFPGEHLDKSLNQIREALKRAAGNERGSLQKAKKILEQADRLMDKVKNKP